MMNNITKIGKDGVSGTATADIASRIVYAISGNPIAIITGAVINGMGNISMYPILYQGDKQYVPSESIFDIPVFDVTEVKNEVACIVDELKQDLGRIRETSMEFTIICGDRHIQLTYNGINSEQLTVSVSRIVDGMHIQSTIIYEYKNGLISVIKESKDGDYYTDYFIDPGKVAVEIGGMGMGKRMKTKIEIDISIQKLTALNGKTVAVIIGTNPNASTTIYKIHPIIWNGDTSYVLPEGMPIYYMLGDTDFDVPDDFISRLAEGCKICEIDTKEFLDTYKSKYSISYESYRMEVIEYNTSNLLGKDAMCDMISYVSVDNSYPVDIFRFYIIGGLLVVNKSNTNNNFCNIYSIDINDLKISL